MSELKFTLDFEDGPEDFSVAKEEMFKECELLKDWVNDNNIASASTPEISTSRNVKGVEIAIGTIILTAIIGKAIDALLQYIKHRIESGFQKYDYIFIFQKGEKRLDIKSSNFTDLEISKLIKEMEDCFGGD